MTSMQGRISVPQSPQWVQNSEIFDSQNGPQKRAAVDGPLTAVSEHLSKRNTVELASSSKANSSLGAGFVEKFHPRFEMMGDPPNPEMDLWFDVRRA